MENKENIIGEKSEVNETLVTRVEKINTYSTELELLLMEVRHKDNALQVAEAYKKLCEFNDWLLRAMRIPAPVAKPE